MSNKVEFENHCMVVDDDTGRRCVFHRRDDGSISILVGSADVERDQPNVAYVGDAADRFLVSSRTASSLTKYLATGEMPYRDKRPDQVKNRHLGRVALDGDDSITENQQKGLFKLHRRAAGEEYAVFMFPIVAGWSKQGAKKEQWYLKLKLDKRRPKK